MHLQLFNLALIASSYYRRNLAQNLGLKTNLVMTRKLYTLLLLFVGFAFQVNAQTIVTITDGDLVGNTTYDWTKDNVYLLDGFVYLEAGGVLNIEPGTVIKAKNQPSTNDRTTALIITRDAKIFANGTANAPIVFTAEADDPAAGDDIPNPQSVRGLWGGLIVLGNASLAFSAEESGIEGIDASEDRAKFGGSNDADNSGIIRYVSIRHGGDELAPGDEINGLTLGGVGSGTVIEYVEVFANLDDGIELFGGTVNVKWASVSFCGDDSFDWDFGWRGKGQFWFSMNGSDISGRGGEHDGASPDGQNPFSQPTIYNATYIGSGIDATPGNEGNDFALFMRDRTGGFYHNSIITDFPQYGLAIEDRDGDGDAYNNFVNGDLKFVNNLWFGFGNGNEVAQFVTLSNDDTPLADDKDLVATLAADGNQAVDPSLGGISRLPDGGLDPRPNGTSLALAENDNIPIDDFFTPVSYRGAFSNGANWMLGWTALSINGFFGDLATPLEQGQVTITDADLQAGQSYNWTANNVYTLDGFVYLEEGGVLNIDAGTIIKAKNQPTTGDRTSALVITRGAQIFANGAADAPIIFTAEADDPTLGFDIPNPQVVRGLWGGLIVLGNASLAFSAEESGIEGIDASEARAKFGGTDDTDNSGVLRYVSIRHGGDELAPGDEINGLTLGGVGSGTTIEHVEVFANLDDGIELFGGTVDIKWASVSFCGDDSFDWDFGWRGRGQYWFSLNGDDVSGRGGEHDGASPDGQDPFSQPTIYNATYIGSGIDASPGNEGNDFALFMRDRTGGVYANSIITDFPQYGLAIEDRDGDGDAYNNFVNDNLQFLDNIWFGFGNGNDPAQFLTLSNDDTPLADDKDLVTTLIADGNQVVDPAIAGITRNPSPEGTSGELDPRPNSGPASFGAPNTAPNDGFFNRETFFGAFSPERDLWLRGWTALDINNFLGNIVVGLDDLQKENEGFVLTAPAPTPSFDLATVSFELPSPVKVNMTVHDLTGRLVRVIKSNEFLFEGPHQEMIDVSNLPNGTYFIVMQAEGVQLVQKMIVTK